MVLSHGLGFRRLADRWQAKISVCKLREFSGLLEPIVPYGLVLGLRDSSSSLAVS